MNVWIVFLFASFVLGARLAKRERRERPALVLVASVLVSALFLLERFA